MTSSKGKRRGTTGPKGGLMAQKPQRTPAEPEPRPPGRPAKPMPEPIPDTVEGIARAIMRRPPKKRWRYLGQDDEEKGGG